MAGVASSRSDPDRTTSRWMPLPPPTPAARSAVLDLTNGSPEWHTAVKRSNRDGMELALPRLHEPAFNDSEVVLGQPAAWVDPM